MQGIAGIIEELVMAAVLSHKTSPRKSKTDWALIALSVLLGCAGIFMAMVALERFFEKQYPLDLAALLTAGVILAVAALVALIAYCCRHKKPPALATGRHELESSLVTLLESICAELESTVRENPKTAVLIAAIVGFITAHRKI